MAAPTGQWPNKTFCVEAINIINQLIDLGITAGGTTITTTLSTLATERDAR